jgi:hypothetical protein
MEVGPYYYNDVCKVTMSFPPVNSHLNASLQWNKWFRICIFWIQQNGQNILFLINVNSYHCKMSARKQQPTETDSV